MKPERDERIAPSGTRLIITRREVLAAAALSLAAGPVRPVWAAADGQLTWAIHVSLAPAWFEPAEASGIITPFMVFYALHDAMVKPMPEKPLAPSLAESWSAPEDGRTYEFMLRDGAKFHNGDPVTAEDVKFSFERYRGTAHDLLQQRVATVEALDTRRVRFQLKEPWPDFLLFYATMTGAGWVVPKKYVEKVGDEGFKKAPWHDVRVRRAASLAIDRKGTNDALTLGYSKITGNPIVPNGYEFFWQPPAEAAEYDPEKAKKLLAEAGFQSGFDAGDYYCDS